MENYSFLDVVKDVAEETGMTRSEANLAVQATVDVVARAVAGGKRVKIGNFGSFVRSTQRYHYVDRATGQSHSGEVPVIRFGVSGLLREILRTGEPVGTLRRSARTR